MAKVCQVVVPRMEFDDTKLKNNHRWVYDTIMEAGVARFDDLRDHMKVRVLRITKPVTANIEAEIIEAFHVNKEKEHGAKANDPAA
jgi:hypothetical protein